MTSKQSAANEKYGPDLEGQPCPVCRVGKLRRGTSTSTLERGGPRDPSGSTSSVVIVVKEVPGWVCDTCGESYHEAGVTDRLFELAESAIQRGAEVEVLRYSAEVQHA